MKKILRVLLVLCLLLAFGITASATCQGYSDFHFSVMDRFVLPDSHPNVTVWMKKCNCLPVNNYLSVSAQAQYKEPNSGIAYPVYSPVNVNMTYGTNIARVDAVASPPDYGIIVWAQGSFYARCGSNVASSFTRTWTEDPADSIGAVEE